jgi:polyisoprenyl-teichoic acid--peptidoglycan teichoic acid transferase
VEATKPRNTNASGVYGLNKFSKSKKVGKEGVKVDLRKKGYPEKIKKIFAAAVMAIVLSVLIPMAVMAIDFYSLYEASHVTIDRSDAALGISQTTTTETTVEETTTEETTTEKITTIATPTPKPKPTKIVVKATPMPKVTPIPVDIKNLPKCETVKIMIFGTNQGLADSIKIISINKTLNVMDMVSVERDLKVTFQGKDYKINELYAKLGPLKFLKWFNEYFHTDVRDYVVIDYDAFVKCINAIGGVTVEVKEKDRNEINKCIERYCSDRGLNFKTYKIEQAGIQLLNGIQALNYSRARKQDSDVGRSNRQDVIISAVIDKTRSMGLDQLQAVVKQLLSEVKTTLDFDTILNLAFDYVIKGGYSIQTQILPSGNSVNKEGMIKNLQGEIRWYIVINLETMISQLNYFLNYNIKLK